MGSIDTGKCVDFDSVSKLIFSKETLEKINIEHQKLVERFGNMVYEALGKDDQGLSDPVYNDTLDELVRESVRLIDFTFPLVNKLFEHLLLINHLDHESAAKYRKLMSKVNSG